MAFNITGISPVARFAGTLLTGIGTSQQIGAYKAAGSASMASAKYNKQLEDVASQKRETDLGRQLASVMSTQRAQLGASGVSISSKSALALMNESISAFEAALMNERNTSDQRGEAIMFEGRAAKAAADNRATAARVGQFSNIFSTILGG